MVEKIRKLCDSNGMSLNDLEERLDGVGKNTIYRWDVSAPNIMRVVAVADFFGVSLDWLLDREVNMNDQDQLILSNLRNLNQTQRESIMILINGYAAQNPTLKESEIV